MSHFLEVIGLIIVLYLLSSTFKAWSLRSRFHNAVSQYGCKPAKRYPNLDPFLGFDLSRVLARENKHGNRSRVFPNLHRKYGDTFSYKNLSPTRISTCNPKNIQAILATNADDWGVEPIRGGFADPFIGKGVFMHDGQTWKRARARIRPTFNRAEIADLENLEIHVGRLLALLPRDGRTVDLQPLFKRLFLDTSSEFIFGQSVESLLPDTPFDSTEFTEAFDAALLGVTVRSRVGPFKPLYYFDKSWEKAYTKVHKFVDKHVRAALQHQGVLEKSDRHGSDGEKKERHVLLRQMVQETQDPLALRSQILNIFFPARDTSAIAISNVTFMLARHPKYWESLRAEVKSIGDQALTFDLIRSLKATKAIISETLRLRSPASLVPRAALRDTILPAGGGSDQLSPLFVPKGTVVFSNVAALHTNPKIWGDDVHEFKPERWGEGRPLWEAKWQYEPFSGGARICPAQQMVLTQVAYLLVRLAQEFKGLENRDEVEEFLGEIKATVQSRNGTKVSLTPA
ncbi:cytochrome P450 [Stipitochalara longipes BDJ]|nr:cytochrome P450 [Stipitochalara longipes BDJ]